METSLIACCLDPATHPELSPTTQPTRRPAFRIRNAGQISRPAKSLAFLALFAIAPLAQGESVAWDGGGNGTSWHDPLNWSGDALPGVNDDVLIDVAANPTVQFNASAGSVTVKNLLAKEAMVFSGGSLTVTDSTAVSADLSINASGIIIAARLEIPAGGTLSLNNGGQISADSVDVQAGGRLNLNTAATFGAVHVAAGGVLGHAAGDADFSLTVTGNMTVDSGGGVNADGRGYAPEQGAGAGANQYWGGAGASHGGWGTGAGGGQNRGAPYGSLITPLELGSGGGGGRYGSGGRGGGCLALKVGGTLLVDGVVSSNGVADNYSGGGGAGGSVNLHCTDLAGSGQILADGADSASSSDWGGAGGGGRIAIRYTNNGFSGMIGARGGLFRYNSGNTRVRGGAGTIYMLGSAQDGGSVTIDNRSTDLAGWDGTPLPDGVHVLSGISAFQQCTLQVPANTTLSFTPNVLAIRGECVVAGKINSSRAGGVLERLDVLGTLSLNNGGQISADAVDVQAGGRLNLNTAATFGAVHVASGGVLSHTAGDADFSLTVTGNMTVDSGGGVNADGRGYAPEQGPGAGANQYWGGAGASHGGWGTGAGGGQNRGAPYGSLITPLELGSGGGGGRYGSGGRGGGCLALKVGGTLLVDGVVSSNGVADNYSGGGGAGGSVNLQCSDLAGSGQILADGADSASSSDWGGAGGGGRIAIRYTNNGFSGMIGARGGLFRYNSGNTRVRGGAGTIYMLGSSQEGGTLTIDNRSTDLAGWDATPLPDGVHVLSGISALQQCSLEVPANTILSFIPDVLAIRGECAVAGKINSSGASGVLERLDVLGTLSLNNGGQISAGAVDVQAGGRLNLNMAATFGAVHVAAGGVLSHAAGDADFSLTVTGNMTVDEGGAVNADGKGYGAGSGPGAGGSAADGNGGGYGGRGSGGWAGNFGGLTYGSPTEPVDMGSGGGNGSRNAGASGGGVIRLFVAGELRLDGNIQANGANAGGTAAYGGGGGAGGGIWITAGQISGGGVIAANGGRAVNGIGGGGGGGGGGRIAVYFQDGRGFRGWGNCSVAGGLGNSYGEDGTIYRNGPEEFRNPEDYEDGWGFWYRSGSIWQLRNPTNGPITAHTGNTAACGNTGVNYTANSTSRLISPSFTVPSGEFTDRRLLYFWQWYQYGTGDTGQVQVSVFDGRQWGTWATIATPATAGGSGGWKEEVVDLTEFQGQMVRVGFLHTADADASVGAGWFIDDLSFNGVLPEAITLGDSYTGTLADEGSRSFLSLQVPPGGHLDLSLVGPTGSVLELYARRGSIPTAGSYDVRAILPNSPNQTISIPDAAAGTWYITVYATKPGTSANTFTLTPSFRTGISLAAVTPSSLGNGADASVEITGAGFEPSAQVALVKGAQTVAATDTAVVSSGKIVADLGLSGLEPGVWTLRVTQGPDIKTLPFQITASLIGPKLETNIIVPRSVGYHAVATLWVEYKNTGDTAMPAPLLNVYGEQNSRRAAFLATTFRYVTQGFWTSAVPQGFTVSAQVVASGATPGILQPGESGRVPIYYAGFQQPWDFNYPPINFHVGVLKTTDTNPADWPAIKDTMRPDYVRADAWNALWESFTTEVGPTWGGYLAALDQNAAYLHRIGVDTNEITRLLGFELRQADALNPIRYLARGTDAAMAAPGLSLTFSRAYAQPISRRYEMGPLGRGWAHEWQWFLKKETDGTIRITGMTGTPQIFQPDSRSAGKYFSSPGDQDVLTALAGGAFQLRKPDGTLMVFKSDGNLDYLQDTNSNRITCCYSGGRLSTLTHSAGPSITLGYNGAGRIGTVTDSQGRVTTLSYDASGEHLTTVLSSDGRTTAYSYLSGQGAPREHALSQITYPGNSHRSFTYDAQGRVATTYADGNAGLITFGYDSTGTVTATNALGHTSKFYFDDYGQILKTVNPLGHSVLIGLDEDRNVKKVTDPAGRSYAYDYDSKGNLTRFTDPLGQATRFTYTADFNRLATLSDAKSNLTRYGYDARGNLKSITYPDSSAESWTPLANGLPETWTNRRGKAITVTWNTQSLPTRKTYADGTHVDFTYDAMGNLTTTVDATGTTTYTYDGNEYLIQIDYPGGRWLKFTYDSAGRRSTSLNQLGHQLTYHYDTPGRLSHIVNEASVEIVRYHYDTAGRLERKDLGNGVYTIYEYDAAGQLLHLINRKPDASVLSRFDYTYDVRGRRMTMATIDGAWTYDYDETGQLTRAVFASTNVTIPSQDLNYEYDALGNRIRTIENGVTTAYTSNNLNQYKRSGDTTFEFDADGNLKTETSPSGTTTYSYDDENRLIGLTKGADSWTYTYDAFGQRVATTENGTTTRFMIDPIGLGNVVGEYDNAGALIARYDHGAGLVSRTGAAADAAYYSFDALGSTSEMTGSTGSVLNRYVYAPFGAVLNQIENSPNPFQFIGAYGVTKEFHSLSFMRARFYDTASGRFSQSDPIGIAGGFNIYAYVQNNPVTMIDPLGLCPGGKSNPWLNNTLDFLKNDAGPEILGRSIEIQSKAFQFVWKKVFIATQVVDITAQLTESYYNFKNQDYFSGAINLTKSALSIAGMVNPYAAGASFLWSYADYMKNTIDDSVNSARAAAYCALSKDPVQPPSPITNPGGDGSTGTSGSNDPNELLGPGGYGPKNFVSSTLLLPYCINFENYSTATAPAQHVVITNPLPAAADVASFELTGLGFGDKVFTIPPGTRHWEHVEPMSMNGTDFEVRIEAGIRANGEVYANLQSIVPSTGLPPPVEIGFLPPEPAYTLADPNAPVAGRGQGRGYVSYTVRPKTGQATGTELRNIASIVFDAQPAIATNLKDPHNPSAGTDPNKEALVTLDTVAPTSRIEPLPAVVAPIFRVGWSGTDGDGSGIASYTVHISSDGGATWNVWLTDTTLTTAFYSGTAGKSYRFHVVAKDHVGNIETVDPATNSVGTQVIGSAMITIQQPTGTTIPADTGKVSFGRVKTGVAATRTFTIRNKGPLALSGIQVKVTGTVASAFKVSAPKAISLAPGASTTFVVAFLPPAANTLTAELQVTSDDPILPNYKIALTGTGVAAPKIAVKVSGGATLTDGKSAINFGGTKAGGQGTGKTLTISNRGLAKLSKLSVTCSGTNKADFIITPLKVTSLAPGKSAKFTITFKPKAKAKAKGIRKAVLHIKSNDPNSPSFDITLMGKGLTTEKTASAAPSFLDAFRLGEETDRRFRAEASTMRIQGLKYRAITITRNENGEPGQESVEVSPNLMDWYSGAKHTTVVEDTAERLKVRDNTPLTPETKRYIRLKTTGE